MQRNDTDERGLISVVFPESTEEGDYYTAFLFRIEDKASGNVTYIWQVLIYELEFHIFSLQRNLTLLNNNMLI